MKIDAFAFAAALTVASALAGPTAQAQTPAAPAVPPAEQALAYTEADAGAVLNARLAALKAVVGMTPAQDALWAPLEAAIRDAGRRAAERRAQRFGSAPPASFLDVLGGMADAEMARGQDLRRVVDAAGPFVATLTDAQKRRIPAFLGMTDAGQTSAELWLFEEEEG